MLQNRSNDAPLRADYTEKRDYLRMQVETDVEFTPPGQTKRQQGKTKNLCSAGMLFETDQPVKLGEELEISVQSAGAKYPPLRAIASVLRVHPAGSGKVEVACRLKEVR